ncbi:MAG: hypothetical protein U1F55_11125 [Chitinivorax sp.]
MLRHGLDLLLICGKRARTDGRHLTQTDMHCQSNKMRIASGIRQGIPAASRNPDFVNYPEKRKQHSANSSNEDNSVAVTRDQRIMSHQVHWLHQCLGNEDTVERVLMM